jgi:general secretion pathway protein F
MEGANASEVKAKLSAQGMIPIEVLDEAQAVKNGVRNLNLSQVFSKHKKAKTSDVLLFTEKFSVLLKAGLPLDKSLSLLVNLSEKPDVKKIAENLLKDVNSGKSLAESMAKHPNFFSTLYISMVKAGEAAGVVDKVMEQLLDYLRSRDELKSYVISSLIYPALLMLVGIGTIGILIVYVLPKFQDIFETLDQELPGPTQMLLSFSDFVVSYKYLIILIIAAAYFGYKYWVSTENGKRQKDGIMLKLPVLKNFVIEAETARISMTAGILLTSAVPLIQTLTIIKEIVSNVIFKESITPVVNGAKKGEGVAGPMEKTGMFPPLAVHLIKVGEESGNLGEMFMKVGEIYQNNIRKSIKGFISLFEPALILIMGVVIGMIVASMLLAMFSLNEAPF